MHPGNIGHLAFGATYQFSFLEGFTDSLGLTPGRYRVTFLRNNATGTPVQLLPGKSPLRTAYKDTADTRYSPTLPSEYTISLVCETSWDAQSFYVSDDNELQVKIEWDSTGTGDSYQTHWLGWVQPTQLQETYGPKPYPITIKAVCGLSLLKDRPLLPSSGVRLQGYVSESEVIRTALEKTGFSLDLQSAIGLYGLADMATGQVDLSPASWLINATHTTDLSTAQTGTPAGYVTRNGSWAFGAGSVCQTDATPTGFTPGLFRTTSGRNYALVRVRPNGITSAGSYVGLGLNYGPEGVFSSGFSLLIRDSQTVVLLQDGVNFLAYIPCETQNNTWYWMKLIADEISPTQTRLYGKIWPDGSPEPGEQIVDHTVNAKLTGYPALFGGNNGATACFSQWTDGIVTNQGPRPVASPARDPLFQTMLLSDRFVNDNGELISCYDALQMILKPYGARLSQQSGRWLLIQADIAAGGFDPSSENTQSVRVRQYTSANLTDGPTAHYPLVLSAITNNRGTLRVSKEDDPVYWQETLQPGVRVAFRFGRGLSDLGDFSNVDATGLPIGYNTNALTPAQRYRLGTGTEADPYRLVITGAGDEKYNANTPYVWTVLTYSAASNEYRRFMKRTFKTRARLTACRAAKFVFVALRDNEPYLFTGGDWIAFNKVKKDQAVGTLIYNVYKDTSGHDKALPGWFDVNIDLGTIDRVREIRVLYCQAEATEYYPPGGGSPVPETGQSGTPPKIEYQAGRLEVEEQGFPVDAIQETILRPGKTLKDTTLTLDIGDVPSKANPYGRIGTTYQRGTLAPTTTWYRGDANILAPNPTGKDVGKTLLRWLTESFARQYLNRATIWEGTLLGRLPYGIHTVVYVQGLGKTVGGELTLFPFQIVRLDSDLRMATHRATLVQIMTDAPLPATPKAEWQTPGGLVPVENGEDGNPAEVAQSPVRGLDSSIENKLKELGIYPASPLPVRPKDLFVPIDPNAPKFGATGYNNGIKIGSVLSALRRSILYTRPR